jgi:hypothetical protein
MGDLRVVRRWPRRLEVGGYGGEEVMFFLKWIEEIEEKITWTNEYALRREKEEQASAERRIRVIQLIDWWSDGNAIPCNKFTKIVLR